MKKSYKVYEMIILSKNTQERSKSPDRESKLQFSGFKGYFLP